MKAKILNSEATVYSDMSKTAPPVTVCATGHEVEFGTAKQNEGETWVEVTLSDGRQGYILGNTRHFPANKYHTSIPIVGDTISAIFPNKCVYCGEPKEAELEMTYDESPKGDTSVPGAISVKLQVPYCAKHARESRRNRLAWVTSLTATLILAALAAIAVIYNISQEGIFGMQSGALVLLFAIIGGCGGAYFTFQGMNFLTRHIMPRIFKSWVHMGTGQNLPGREH